MWVLIAGVVGLTAAITLTVEKIELLMNPAYVPSCSINPVLSCGSVMVTPQASEFGFPNSLIGIVGVHGGRGHRRAGRRESGAAAVVLGGLAAGTLLGVVFVHWLICQSLYHIGALCPYCMVVWTVTIPLLVVVVVDRAATAGGQRLARVLYQWRWSLVALWFTGADSDDPGAVLELLVDADLERSAYVERLG